MDFDARRGTGAIDLWRPESAPEAPGEDRAAGASAPVLGLGSGIAAVAGQLFQGLFDDGGPASNLAAAGIGGVKPVPKPYKPGKQPQREPGKGGDGKDDDGGDKGDKGPKIPGQKDEFEPSKERKPGMPKLNRDSLFGAPPAEEVAKARGEAGLATLTLLLTLAAPEVMIPAELIGLLLASTTGGPASGLGPATAPPQML